MCINKQSSEWAEVSSGVPQGSVLGPLLFVIFINDLPDNVSPQSNPFIFADDTKILREISNAEDNQALQRDIDSLVEWSDDNKMYFHSGKCKVLGIGRNKSDYAYKMRDDKLERVKQEKDLGVTFDASLSFEIHMAEKISKANRMTGIIRRTFHYLDKDMFLNLYKALVRPHIEYANQVWSPRLKKHRESIENVQRRATKMIPGMKELSYIERLKKLELPTLAYRRLRGDLIEIFKIMTGKYDEVVSKDLLEVAKIGNTRGHKFKLFTPHCNTNVRKLSFPYRCIGNWNTLPPYVINATTLPSFERRLDRFLKHKQVYYDFEADINDKVDATTITTNNNDCDPDLT